MSAAVMPKDEAGRPAYASMQEKDSWWLSNLQTIDCSLLLPRQALSGGQVSGAVLSKYQAEAQATTNPTKVNWRAAVGPASKQVNKRLTFILFLFRLQQQQLLRRRVAMMNTRMNTSSNVMSTNVAPMQGSTTPNNSSTNVSPVHPNQSPIGSLGSPHQPGVGVKPGTQTPPANVLQVVKQVSQLPNSGTTNGISLPLNTSLNRVLNVSVSQVQEEAARQQVPHASGFGKVTPTGSGQMLPPGLQRPGMQQHIAAKQNPQAQQNPNVNVPNNLLPMDQWGSIRMPSTSNQGNQIIRPNNPMPMVGPNQLQQQVT